MTVEPGIGVEGDRTDLATSAAVQRYHTRFDKLVDLAEEYLDSGEPRAAAALSQIAGRCAFPDFSGLFASPRLEQVLLRLGRELPAAPSASGPAGRGSRRQVLHVLTYGRPVGGDGRFVWRWMLEDKDSQHSVAITSQSHYKGVFEIPEFLRRAAEESGGQLRALRASASRPLEQAQELRSLCRRADVVALHLWPHDIVPVLALASGCDSAKTLFMNHSDHTFWIGGSVSHSIAHLRKQDPRFLSKRRGLQPERASILPIPLAHRPPSLDNAQAKAELGLPPDTVLLLTVASPFKFSAPGQVGFLELVTPIVKTFKNAVLVAIGPKDEGIWHSTGVETDGRIRPLGPRWNNELYFAAADVYLDSVPFSSITSLLEAGSQGLPVLAFKPQPELGLLGPGAPGIDDSIELAGDAEAYQSVLSRLITDLEFRQHSGDRARRQILALHTGSGWLRAVQEAYSAIEGNLDRGCLQTTRDHFEAGPLDHALARLYVHAHEPTRARLLIRNYVGALRYRSRISVTRKLHSGGSDISLMNLVPPPANAILRAVGRPAKRIVGSVSASIRRGQG